MQHAPESQLRRFHDEPFAVPDRYVRHLDTCRRCRDRFDEITSEADRCGRLLLGLQPMPDVEQAWERLLRESGWLAGRPVPRRGPGRTSSPRLDVRGGSTRRVGAAAAAVLVLAAAAAVGTAANVFAPARSAPTRLGNSDIATLASFMGLGDHGGGRTGAPGFIGGFATRRGRVSTPFGALSWSATASPETAPSVRAAARDAGFPLHLPRRLPAGVTGPKQIIVQPRVAVTVRFNSQLPGVGGSSIRIELGPAVLAVYGGAGGTGMSTLGILQMPRPVAASSGPSVSRIAAFLLGRRDLPAHLGEELRLLGALGTTLPVQLPAGASERSVRIAGSPGVLVSDDSQAASAVLWEDDGGMLRIVAGLVDRRDALGVADQLR